MVFVARRAAHVDRARDHQLTGVFGEISNKRGLRNANISCTAWHTAGGDVYRLPSAAGSDEIRRRLRQHMSMPAVCIQLLETDPKTALCTWDGAESHCHKSRETRANHVLDGLRME